MTGRKCLTCTTLARSTWFIPQVLPLLGVMYVVIGMLQLWLDAWLASVSQAVTVTSSSEPLTQQAVKEPARKEPKHPGHTEVGPAATLSFLRPVDWLRGKAPEGSWLKLLGATW